MSHLILHTEFLLRTESCVCVPGLGGFLLHREPAFYDAEHCRFYPPYFRVSFNSRLNHDDGLLAESVARRDQMDFASARRVIEDETAALLAAMKADGEIKFGSLGTFVHNPEAGDSLEFVPAKRPSYLPELSVVPIQHEREQEEFALTPKLPVSRTLFMRSMRVAATVIVLFVLGILLSTPVSVEHNNVALAKPELPQVQPPCKAVVETVVEVELNIAEPSDPDATSEYVPASFGSGNYGLVVASLASRAEAERYVAAHPARYLEIYTPASRFRIIAAKGDSPAELMRIINDKAFADEFPEAWPCKL